MIYTAIWGHRGASAYTPENTLTAFDMSRKMGADGIELDVHLTRDGKVVVIHDNDIKRTSNGEGIVEEMTYDELLKYDFGNPGVFGNKFEGTQIPLLSEVYELFDGTGMTVNVEIKNSLDGVVEETLKIAAEYGYEDKVIYSSFVHEYLAKAKKLDPSTVVAPLFKEEPDFVTLAKTLSAVAVHPAWQTVAQDGYIKTAHGNGIRVHAWTVNDAPTINKLLVGQVDAIITNFPDIAVEMRNSRLRLFE